MTNQSDHSSCVDAWMGRAAAPDAPLEDLVLAFEEASRALWQRAHLTLGDLTLTAMLDRVLSTAVERFPFLSAVELQSTGLRCDELRARANDLPGAELAAGIRFVLVETLTVVGNLTAEILTPALHAELSKLPGSAGRAIGDEPADHPGGAAREGGQS